MLRAVACSAFSSSHLGHPATGTEDADRWIQGDWGLPARTVTGEKRSRIRSVRRGAIIVTKMGPGENEIHMQINGKGEVNALEILTSSRVGNSMVLICLPPMLLLLSQHKGSQEC